MNESQAIAVPTPRNNMKVILGLILVTSLGLLVLFAWRLIQVSAPALASGEAPTFELKTYDGQTIRLSDLRGKAVAVNFWASWCQPCREEAPLLEAAWEKYKDRGFILVGVDYVDTEPAARAYMKEFKLTYPNGPDVQTLISQAYRITGVPETYFITKDGEMLAGKDADGKPYANWIGPLNKAALEERIEKLLAQ